MASVQLSARKKWQRALELLRTRRRPVRADCCRSLARLAFVSYNLLFDTALHDPSGVREFMDFAAQIGLRHLLGEPFERMRERKDASRVLNRCSVM